MAPVHGLGCVFARENFYQLRETNFKIGLCGENRTPDPMLPKQVRYQLRYTERCEWRQLYILLFGETIVTKYSIAKIQTSYPGVFSIHYLVSTCSVTGHPLHLGWYDLENAGERFKIGLREALDAYLKKHPQYALRDGKLCKQFMPRPRKDKSLERPAYVLACLDHPKYNDRYTVYLGGEFLTAPNDELRNGLNTNVAYLAMNAAPTHPQGVSQMGETSWVDYDDYVKRNRNFLVSWDDLPENIRKHVRSRCE